MNSSLNSSLIQIDMCYSIYKIYDIYFDKSINSTGLLLNLLNVLVYYILIAKKYIKSDMYKYLLFKSLFDAYYSLRNLLFIFYDCNYCNVKPSPVLLVIYWILILYLGFVCQMCSILCEIGAYFERYKSLSQALKKLKKISFKKSLFFMVLFSSGFYSYKFFERYIKRVNFNKYSNHSEYILAFSKFGTSDLLLNVEFLHNIIRDGVCVLIILVLNILTGFKIKKSLDKKSSLIDMNKSKSESSEMIKKNKSLTRLKVIKAEIKISFMVVTTGTITIIGHGLIFVYNVPNIVLKTSFCFYSFANFCYSLSYAINFIIYYIFNKTFRSEFNLIFNKLIKTIFPNCYKSHLDRSFTTSSF